MAAPLSPSGNVRRNDDVDPAGAAAQIAALTATLQERESLIEALTERLEEAAEQLDRIHRSGGDRARNASQVPSFGGVPSELIERQMVTAERLDAALTEWEEKQGTALLERIDLRIDRLIDILRGDAAAIPAAGMSDSEPPLEQLSGETGLRSISAEIAAAPPPTPHEAHAAEIPHIELPEPPGPVDNSETDPEVLLEAVRAREDYISYLISELRHQQPTPVIDWDAIHEAPEELLSSLKALENRLQRELKREELDLSLERARLAREAAHLEQVRTRLEKEIRRLGIEKDQAELQQSHQQRTPPAQAHESGSWKRLFGRK